MRRGVRAFLAVPWVAKKAAMRRAGASGCYLLSRLVLVLPLALAAGLLLLLADGLARAAKVAVESHRVANMLLDEMQHAMEGTYDVEVPGYDDESRPVLTSVLVMVRGGSGRVIADCVELVQLVSQFIDYSSAYISEHALRWKLRDVVRLNSAHVLKFFVAWTPTPLDTKTDFEFAMIEAVARGDLALVRWLHHFNPSFQLTSRVLGRAASNGYLEIAQWLTSQRQLSCSKDAVVRAATAGHLEMLHWLVSTFPDIELSSKAMDAAACHGHLGVVRWLQERQVECSAKAMDDAVRAGHLDVVQWLYTKQVKSCSAAAVRAAARNGHLDVAQWLREHRSQGSVVT